MPSMVDVARLCGVSVRTVSRAFSTTEYIDAGTRERVLQVADKLGYSPNLTARALRTGQSYAITAVAGGMDELHTAKMAAFEQVVRDAGYAMNILFVPPGTRRKDALDVIMENIALQRPAAVAVFPNCPVDYGALTRKFGAQNVPYAVIDKGKRRCVGVKIDRGQGVFDAIAHLVDRGHRHIGYAGPTEDRSRLDGFERAIAALGVRATMLSGDPGGGGAEAGREAARLWLALKDRKSVV